MAHFDSEYHFSTVNAAERFVRALRRPRATDLDAHPGQDGYLPSYVRRAGGWVSTDADPAYVRACYLRATVRPDASGRLG